jgi:HlyD family secretion protein
MTQLLPKSTPKAIDSPNAVPQSAHKIKTNKWKWIAGGGITLCAIALPIYYFLMLPKPMGLQLSGRIEGYETDIGAKIPGRVNFVAVREGDAVKQGQVIAKLEDAELQAQFQGATAKLSAAQQQIQQAQLNLSIISNQLEEAQMNWQQAQGDSQGKVAQAQSIVAAAEAERGRTQALLEEAVSAANLAKINRDRAAELRQAGAYSQQQLDQAQMTYETSQAKVRSAQSALNATQKQVNATQGALVQAQTTSFNPDITQSRIEALQKQMDIARSQLKAAQAEVQTAEAARQQIQAQLAYLTVVSPIDGVVMARSVEPGAIVGSGRTLLTVINPDAVYLRGYVPEGEIGRIKVGQAAQVWLDSNPKQPLSAQVSAIDTQASFTPENVYFKQDRVEQVFGVKLSIEQPNGFAKPGMPADAEISTR